MDWTQILEKGGIEEPPGYQETLQQLRDRREARLKREAAERAAEGKKRNWKR